MTIMTDRIGNVTRQRYEQLVTRAKELIAQVSRAVRLGRHGVGD
ncbi:hypothetical protein [Streptomyces sp. NPDC048825]